MPRCRTGSEIFSRCSGNCRTGSRPNGSKRYFRTGRLCEISPSGSRASANGIPVSQRSGRRSRFRLGIYRTGAAVVRPGHLDEGRMVMSGDNLRDQEASSSRKGTGNLFPIPKHPIAPRRTGQDASRSMPAMCRAARRAVPLDDRGPSGPSAPPATVLALRRGSRGARHVAGIGRRGGALAGLAQLDLGAARHRGGIEGLAGQSPARHPARLAPRPVVRRIGINEGTCGRQVYLL
jgi:hypothetical protein